MVCDKVRIRFRKSGPLRLVSHHDLMRCFERMLRRAALPFHSTQGFNPKPRIVFPLSLGLGIVGHNEVVELELDVELPPSEIARRLSEVAPMGLAIVGIKRIDPRITGQVRRACYRIEIPEQQQSAIARKCSEILASPDAWVQRQRPRARSVDLRPYLRDLAVSENCLTMDLLVTPTGAARPDEILELLNLRELLDQGAVLERTLLELEDETNASGQSAGEGSSGRRVRAI